MDQIRFEAAWLLFIPGDASHGDAWGQLAGALRVFAGEARLVSWDSSQDTLDGRDADLVQLLQ
jgi:hypothetical protein